MCIDSARVNTPDLTHLLQQIAQIQRMERGTLSLMRPGTQSTSYKFQVWENGKNVSRLVSADEAPALQEAIEGYRKFQALTQQYAKQMINKTRTELAAKSKKKRVNPRRKSSWPKTRKSSS
jgi:hypothetical protein